MFDGASMCVCEVCTIKVHLKIGLRSVWRGVYVCVRNMCYQGSPENRVEKCLAGRLCVALKITAIARFTDMHERCR